MTYRLRQIIGSDYTNCSKYANRGKYIRNYPIRNMWKKLRLIEWTVKSNAGNSEVTIQIKNISEIRNVK